ncbi:MAG: aminoglycoside phosphotransferase family protein [Acidobacteriota bacterium]
MEPKPQEQERSTQSSEPLTPERALGFWSRRATAGDELRAIEIGLINRTFSVGSPPRFILQRVHPTFDPRIQQDIAAVTRRLAERGLETPLLLPTDEGELAVPCAEGFWRLMTFVPGTTWTRLERPAQAAAAGRLVGRFHAALRGWSYRPAAPDRRAHETPTRMAELAQALERCDGHPLADPARETGQEILRAWESWEGSLDLPRRLCHGDLKASNLRFRRSADAVEGICLLDLDTLGPQRLACEMGDAWRSWCNVGLEDEPELARFESGLFTASATAWLEALEKAGGLEPEERDSLVPGIERICLELAARFCRDAVVNRYFREDRDRHPQPGEHNLRRALSQLRLAASARDQRASCEAVIRGAG